MTAVSELIGVLIDHGVDPATAAVLVARAGSEMCMAAPSKGAIRTRRWRERKASQTVTEGHKASHCAAPPISILSTPIESNEEEKKKERKRGAPQFERASRLSADWEPSPKDIEYALTKGITRDRIPIVAEKFKNHWLAKAGRGATALNWHLKWCTWVMNEIEWSGQPRTTGYANGQPRKRTVHDAANDLYERLRELDKPGTVRGGAGETPVRRLSSG